MNKTLYKLFDFTHINIKNYDKNKIMENNLEKGRNAAFLGTILTIAFTLIKGLAGFICGSQLLIADAIHSGVDVVSIFAAWIGLKVSIRESDDKFHYGYFKAENLATLFISLFIFYAAIEIFIESYKNLSYLQNLTYAPIAIAVPLLSAVISFYLGKYQYRIGNSINAQSLIATGREMKLDAFSSIVVFMGIILSYFKIPYINGIIGFFIGFLILKIGYDCAKSSILSLMDASPDIELEEILIKDILDIPGVKTVETLRLRQSGPYIFGETEVCINKKLDINTGHDIADKINHDLQEKHSELRRLLVHIEPYTSHIQKIMIPLIENKGLESCSAKSISEATHLFYGNLDGANITSWNICVNSIKKQSRQNKTKEYSSILIEKLDSVILSNISSKLFITLKNNYVDIFKTEQKNIVDVIGCLHKKQLEKLDMPTSLTNK